MRNESLYNFLSLFLFLVLPNIKEVKSYELTGGSLSIGMKDLLIFPQLVRYYEKFPKNITCIINLNMNKKNQVLSKYVFSSIQLPLNNIWNSNW